NGCGQLNFEGCASGESLEQANLNSNRGQLCCAVPRTAKIELDEESTFFLMKLKAKLGKHLSDQEFLKLVLKERAEQEFPVVAKQNRMMKPEKFKKKTAEEAAKQGVNQWAVELKMALCSEKVAQENVIDDTFGSENHHPQSEAKVTETETPPKITRYVKATKKRQTIARTNGKCSYPNCNSPFQILHHVDRFSESKSHESLIPLCKTHHEFAHNNLIQNESLSPKQWGLAVAGHCTGSVVGSVAGSVVAQGAEPAPDQVSTQSPQIPQAEILYRKYRQKALAGSFGHRIPIVKRKAFEPA
ncbi:MAG: hypothetical protein WC285_03990, partial [Candidatus Gracilibacteria bacterium]